MRDDLILLTGITGFIARRIALDLLLAGYRVRGSVRSDKGIAPLRQGLAAHLPDPALLDRLSFVTLDLTADQGWPEALAGAAALIHTASPFPLAQPRDAQALIRPAVDGTLRALCAALAAGVTRVVLTSSVEAVIHGAQGTITEANWSDLSAPTVSAYGKSKTLAERAAWDFVAAHPAMRLTVINPGLVLGTPLDSVTASSVSVVARFLAGRDPAVPDFARPSWTLPMSRPCMSAHSTVPRPSASATSPPTAPCRCPSLRPCSRPPTPPAASPPAARRARSCASSRSSTPQSG
jgi:dihydroflavonol-4-reductase